MYLKWVPSHSMQKTNYMPEMDTSGQPVRLTLGNREQNGHFGAIKLSHPIQSLEWNCLFKN